MENISLLSDNSESNPINEDNNNLTNISLDELKKLETLASSHYKNCQYIDSESILLVIYDQKSRLYGENHIETLQILNNLAATQARLGKYNESEANFRKVLIEKERTIGSNHPDTYLTMNHLGVLLKKMNKMNESEELLSKAYNGLNSLLGANHQSTSEAAYNYAIICVQLGKRRKAARLFKQAHDGFVLTLSNDHQQTIDAFHWHVKCVKMFIQNNQTITPEIEDQEFYYSRKDWKDSSICEICYSLFGYLRRQHHCRICSISVCNACSQFRTIVLEYDPSIPVRLCLVCEQQGF